ASAQKTFEFTSQLYFDDAVSDAVFAQAPYASRGTRDQRNASDGIYSGLSSDGLVAAPSGARMLISLSPTTGGYTGALAVGLVIAWLEYDGTECAERSLSPRWPLPLAAG